MTPVVTKRKTRHIYEFIITQGSAATQFVADESATNLAVAEGE